MAEQDEHEGGVDFEREMANIVEGNIVRAPERPRFTPVAQYTPPAPLTMLELKEKLDALIQLANGTAQEVAEVANTLGGEQGATHRLSTVSSLPAEPSGGGAIGELNRRIEEVRKALNACKVQVERVQRSVG